MHLVDYDWLKREIAKGRSRGHSGRGGSARHQPQEYPVGRISEA
jgi:hypothetical protein